MNNAAALLWTELVTRIASRSLHYRSGSEESAAASVHSLFKTTRQLLGESGPGTPFAEIAVTLLNEVLAPRTSRWHGWMTALDRAQGPEDKAELKFADERVRRMFRAELNELRDHLQHYVQMLATLAKNPDAKDLSVLAPDLLAVLEKDKQSRPGAKLGDPLAAKISAAVSFAGTVTGEDILKSERVILDERRRDLKLPKAPESSSDPLLNATGLALSGGGIRSATFCLGIVQVLVRRRLFHRFDYLSTVSGGGYLGSFLSCALGTKHPGYTLTGEARVQDAFENTNGQSESGLVRHLRNNSKYLLDGGLGTRLKILGLLFSGILWNLLILLPIPLLAAWAVCQGHNFWGGALRALNAGGTWFPSWGDGWLGTGAAWSALLLRWILYPLGVLWLFIPLVQRSTHGHPPGSAAVLLRHRWEAVTLWIGRLALFLGLLFCVPALFHAYDWLKNSSPALFEGKGLNDLVTVSAGGVVSALLGLLAARLSRLWPRLRGVAVRLFIFSGPVVLLFIFLLTGNRLGLGRNLVLDDLIWDWEPSVVLWVSLGLLVWGWLFVNINTLAPHRFYRRKLCDCYLTRRSVDPAKGPLAPAVPPTSAVPPAPVVPAAPVPVRINKVEEVKLTALCGDPAAPYHLINMTVNAPTSKNPDLRGRGGDFFLTSKAWTGSPITGYFETGTVEKIDAHFDLGTAMAVSGAAASSNMGWKTMAPFRFIMALCNVRLGYWLRRPGTRWLPTGCGPWYLYREMLGRMDERSRYLNLSDGGHIENLAAYELLRRRCKFIVCVDGGQEPGMECADLIRLERYASIDLGIQMQYDIADLMLQVNGLSRSHAILVKIIYPVASGEPPATGWMVYLKLAATGIEPAYVREYRRGCPAFPHETTGDQIFEEDQFEAYRALGEWAMEDLFRPEITGTTVPKELEPWFQCLADRLLPDNDAAFR